MGEENIYEAVRAEIANICGVAVESVEGNTNFFELGLDSITVIQLAHRIERNLNIPLSIRDFWVYPSLNEIVKSIELKRADTK